jgi:hypothetical protein
MATHEPHSPVNERLYKALHETHGLQRYFARRWLFSLFQRLGFHITGDHFYEITPNTRLVAERYAEGPRPLAGIDFRLPESERRAVELVNQYGPEYSKAHTKYGFREKNYYFRGLDALLLYAVLRDLKPRKLVEVGQGFSTRISLAALERNAQDTGQEVEFVSIDPYDRFTEEKFPASVKFHCLRQELQSVDTQAVLEHCGFLFIDSTHVYKFGSDVQHELTRVYPSLPPGTVVHIHDIFSPYDYPRDWIVREKRFWNEQYLLEAFLMFNAAFDIDLPVNLLAQQSDALAGAVKKLALDLGFKYRGSSFYLRRK